MIAVRLAPLLRFGVVSGAGLLCDVGVFTTALHLGLRPALANLLGGGIAVTLVFFVSTRFVFERGGEWLAARFALYCGWQLVSMSAYSVLLEALVAGGGLAPLLAKAIVTPMSFLTNYLCMRLLLARPVTLSGSSA
jgi:putative flippase GtrA